MTPVATRIVGTPDGGMTKEVLWDEALEQWRAVLTANQKKKMDMVNSFDELKSRVQKLRERYANRAMTSIFDKVDKVLIWLNNFSQCVRSFLQASPPEFILVWGTLSFIIEVGSSFPCSATSQLIPHCLPL